MQDRNTSRAPATDQPRLLAVLADLQPAYFAMVMATGIVSIAAWRQGDHRVAAGLLAVNVAAYIVLWLLGLARLVRFPRRFLADVTDHSRGPGYFTWVAATCVLGSQLIVIAGAYAISVGLWVWGTLLWVIFVYGVFTGLSVKARKPSLAEGINGGWLLAVVATQSVAVLAALIAERWPQPYRLELNFLALSMWLWGGMLYIWMIALIFYRYTFFEFLPEDLTPPYWINMGAMAISTLAGALLIANTPQAWYLRSLLPFLKGFTVLYWATATWWIPMLVLLGVWRYGYKRYPLRYNPLYWGAVFPLGMYSVATSKMADVMGLDFLAPLPPLFFYVAAGAWALAFVGLARRLWRLLAGTDGAR